MSQKEVWASLQAFGQQESEDEECEKAKGGGRQEVKHMNSQKPLKDDEYDIFHQMYTWYTESLGQISEAEFLAGWESSLKNMYVEALEKEQITRANMPAFMHMEDNFSEVLLWTTEDQTQNTVEEIPGTLSKVWTIPVHVLPFERQNSGEQVMKVTIKKEGMLV